MNILWNNSKCLNTLPQQNVAILHNCAIFLNQTAVRVTPNQYVSVVVLLHTWTCRIHSWPCVWIVWDQLYQWTWGPQEYLCAPGRMKTLSEDHWSTWGRKHYHIITPTGIRDMWLTAIFSVTVCGLFPHNKLIELLF